MSATMLHPGTAFGPGRARGTEWDRPAREAFLPDAQGRIDDAEIIYEVIDAREIVEGASRGPADIIRRVEDRPQVIDVGEIDLRLDGVAQGAATGLQRGLEPRTDEKLGLQPDIGPVPNGIGRPIGRLCDAGHLLVVRHLTGDEYIVARNKRSDEA